MTKERQPAGFSYLLDDPAALQKAMEQR